MLSRRDLFTDQKGDCAVAAQTAYVLVNSGGERVFGWIMMPAVERAEERTPVVLMLHGFPGIDRNTDIAYALCRAGIAVVIFSYRGVWGSQGDYCFSHCLEDVTAVLDHLSDHAEEYRLDLSRVCLFGHSMGGCITLNTAAAASDKIRGVVVAAPCDMGYLYEDDQSAFRALMKSQEPGFFTLPYPGYIEEDVAAHASQWRFVNLAEKIHVPVHFIGASQDAVTPPDCHMDPVYMAMEKLGRRVSRTMIPDGHSFTSHRIALAEVVFDKICDILDVGNISQETKAN